MSRHFNQLPKVIVPLKNTFQNFPLKNAFLKLLRQKKYLSKLLSQRNFVSVSINTVKNKTGKDKSLIMHD